MSSNAMNASYMVFKLISNSDPLSHTYNMLLSFTIVRFDDFKRETRLDSVLAVSIGDPVPSGACWGIKEDKN